MRKNFGVKSWLYPQPVLMIGTYDQAGKPDVMNAAWGGQYEANQVMLCLGEHQTTKNIPSPEIFAVKNRQRGNAEFRGRREYTIATTGKGKASDCIACGQCERSCPQQIDVITQLAECRLQFEE